MNVKAASKTHKCPECGEMFFSATGLGSHRRARHGIDGTTPKAKWKLAPGETEYKCPDCDKRFESPNGIGIHRLRAHGIGRSGKKVSGRFPCPDCDKTFKLAITLASHRKAAHGIQGASHTALRKQRNELPYPEILASPTVCEICGYQAKNINGLAIHKATHKTQDGEEAIEPSNEKTASSEVSIAKTRRNGFEHPEAVARRSLIPEATLAYTAGRVEELLSRTAAEYDVPARTFTAGVIELIYAKTLRR